LAFLKRLCVITGASGVLGTAFISRYREQFQIVAIHHKHELAFATQNQTFLDPLDPSRSLKQNDERVFAIRADLSSEQAVERVCSAVIDQFRRIDILINAAVVRRCSRLLGPSALADAELVMRVNLLAPMRLAIGFAKHFWRSCVEENVLLRRNIVNVSSTTGVYVYPDLGQCVYASSKAALNHATYHLASELWDIGVRANVVAPNTFSSRVPIEKVLDQIVAFDLSDDTGRLVIVDG
jgi:NAD(P)-dependent dehydrogenase (short-subunit alcohol dehydrogenase family)